MDDVSLGHFYTMKHCIILIIAFCILFPTFTLLREYIGAWSEFGDYRLVKKVANESLSTMMRLIYSSIGLAMLFIVIGYKEKNRKMPLPQWIIKIGNLCFGVYLLQQFIRIYIYTDLPVILGFYWLPWVGFVVALVGSIIMTELLIKTKIGKFLIG